MERIQGAAHTRRGMVLKKAVFAVFVCLCTEFILGGVFFNWPFFFLGSSCILLLTCEEERFFGIFWRVVINLKNSLFYYFLFVFLFSLLDDILIVFRFLILLGDFF